MSRAARWIRAAATSVLAGAFATAAPGAELRPPYEGWASWEIPAVDGAPDWCCLRGGWDGATETMPQTCHLDRAHVGNAHRDGATAASIRVYARFSEGRIERLRALSATCPVKAESPIQDLGAVSADDSARWLTGVVARIDDDVVMRHRIAEDVIPTLAIHRSDVALDTLSGIARESARDKLREQAVFWLALLQGREGAAVAAAVMFADPDAHVREHAAVAVAQSQSPHAAADLLRLAATDPVASVREHAIFALSLLPEALATPALITIAEDTSMPRAERKRAVFWLAQSESNEAQAFMAKVLTAVASRTRP